MDDFELIAKYKSFLHHYTLEQLRYIPEPEVWSIGQLYDHLIVVAHEYLDSVEACAKVAGEQKQGKTEFGEHLFKNGGFPPIKIKLPPELDAPPDNKKLSEDIMLELDRLSERMKQLELKVDEINPQQKVEHGGFGWLNAQEWLALVGMHFRHHLRQKEELDRKLKIGRSIE
ncbi:DinB family protein [Sporosarcina gallistercoris]|uniref:DinB family protein n=1 Tax=Sporosarcina gallistercoris TaxID=2762245 RepID=A0ABR8PK38_9BACL|nr:DinB family protein [Sporosarcina gallistercoris]MBD7908524.1 DinB family protein [Sporosarcina gallistercoris]